MINPTISHFYTFKCFTKGNWHNKPIIDVLLTNWPQRSREYYEKALELGVITVNEQIVNPYHKLQHNKYIKHHVHMHEPLPPKIDFLYQDERIAVLNKPAGIPCHPVGAYHFYSVTKAVFGEKRVGCINRLDMPVSGVLLINICNSNDLHRKLMLKAKKFYVAKVKGNFPDEIEVEEPIGNIDNSKIMIIREDGKYAKTIFKKLSYKDGFSLVLCQPITGRTHQIRVHLKHIGFPILHDILYGEGKDAEYELHYDCDAKCDEDDEKTKFIVENCTGKFNRSMAISNLHICLHAWKYQYDNKEFVAKWPEWAEQFNQQ
ncbi:hypothetical protein NUSPORA_01560 [Nucleospora cyclopteri]